MNLLISPPDSNSLFGIMVQVLLTWGSLAKNFNRLTLGPSLLPQRGMTVDEAAVS
jgi:hypothetical protein